MDNSLNPKQSLDLGDIFADLMAPFSAHRENLVSEADSRAVIAREVARGLELRNMNPFTLFEVSGIPMDTIMGVLEGTVDLSDSGAITALEQALQIPLRHL